VSAPAPVLVTAAPPGAAAPRWTPALPPRRWPKRRLVGTWCFISVVTAGAFHETLGSVLSQIGSGDPISYLLLVPVWAMAIAVVTERHQGLAIHDREVDWIVACGPAALVVMVDLLLAPRLGISQELFRVDVLALELFVLCCCVLLFGTRAAGRFWATWLFLLCCWPLPYRLVVAALGGVGAACWLNLTVTGVVLALVLWPQPLRQWRDLAVAGLVAGVLAIGLSGVAPIGAALLPSLVLVGVVVLRQPHRAVHRRPREASVPAVQTRWRAGLVLVVFALGIGLLATFAPPPLHTALLPTATARWSATPSIPAGWRVEGHRTEPWVTRYFGPGATWGRWSYLAAPGAGQRAPMVVDVVTTSSAGDLSVYPAPSCYVLATAALESPDPVAIGHGLLATMFSADLLDAQSPIGAQWVLLTWTWRVPIGPHGEFQRMTVLTEQGIPTPRGLPVPGPPGLNGNIGTAVSDVLRGITASVRSTPDQVTVLALQRFATSLVDLQGARA